MLSQPIKYYLTIALWQEGFKSTNISGVTGASHKAVLSWVKGESKPFHIEDYKDSIETRAQIERLIKQIKREITKKYIRYFLVLELNSRGYGQHELSRRLGVPLVNVSRWILEKTAPRGISKTFYEEDYVKKRADEIEEQIAKELPPRALDYYAAVELHTDYDLGSVVIARILRYPLPTVAGWLFKGQKPLEAVTEPDQQILENAITRIRQELTKKDVNYYVALELGKHGFAQDTIGRLLGSSVAKLRGWLFEGTKPLTANEKIRVEKIVRDRLNYVKRKLTEENLVYFIAFELRRQNFTQKKIAEILRKPIQTINQWLTRKAKPHSLREKLIDHAYLRKLILQKLEEIFLEFKREKEVKLGDFALGIEGTVLKVDEVTQVDAVIILSYVSSKVKVGGLIFLRKMDREVIKDALTNMKALGAPLSGARVIILSNNDAHTREKRDLVGDIATAMQDIRVPDVKQGRVDTKNIKLNEEVPQRFKLSFLVGKGEYYITK